MQQRPVRHLQGNVTRFKSVALNLKDARGKDIFMKLARDADIVIENYRPGVARKLGGLAKRRRGRARF